MFLDFFHVCGRHGEFSLPYYSTVLFHKYSHLKLLVPYKNIFIDFSASKNMIETWF